MYCSISIQYLVLYNLCLHVININIFFYNHSMYNVSYIRALCTYLITNVIAHDYIYIRYVETVRTGGV